MTISLAEFRSLRWSAGGLPMTRAVSQPIGAVAAWLAYRLGLTPSQVTLAGTSLFLVTAWLYATLPQGVAPMLLVFALFELGYGLDCADGQLARATGRTSLFGAWLDVACDYIRNVALAAAIAFWLARVGLRLPLVVIATALLLMGLVVQLHTAVFLSARAPKSGSEGEPTPTAARRAFALFTDTATQLGVLALLRYVPSLLLLYAMGLGAAYVALAWLLARRRLSPAPDAAR